MRTGLPLTQLVTFDEGFPDGDITWELLDGTGATKANGAVTPAAGSVSSVIAVSGAENTIEAGVVTSPRELQWSYTVGGMIQSGRFRYRLDIFLPFGVSEDGVRRKLGTEPTELDDESIDIAVAYIKFQTLVGANFLAAVTGDAVPLVRDAIEAQAAINVLPLLQLRLAEQESSGTSKFKRANIDWEVLRAQLELYVQDGIDAANINVDVTINFGSLLIAAARNDVIAGADPNG